MIQELVNFNTGAICVESSYGCDEQFARDICAKIKGKQQRRQWVIQELLPYLKAHGGVIPTRQAIDHFGIKWQGLASALRSATRYVTAWEDIRTSNDRDHGEYFLALWGTKMPAYMARVDADRRDRITTG